MDVNSFEQQKTLCMYALKASLITQLQFLTKAISNGSLTCEAALMLALLLLPSTFHRCYSMYHVQKTE